MTLLDCNILLYAYDSTSRQHDSVSRWLVQTVNGGEPVGFCWITIWAFIRISTNPRALHNPLTLSQAFSIVDIWLARPGVNLLEPGARHLKILERLVVDYQAAGPLLTNASLAALAVEHGATMASTDQDFARFKELRWVNPVAQ